MILNKVNKLITNITIGVDPYRIQQNEPCYFVSWKRDGEQNYKFFQLLFVAENFKNKLLKEQ
jgi:hypothetical protein